MSLGRVSSRVMACRRDVLNGSETFEVVDVGRGGVGRPLANHEGLPLALSLHALHATISRFILHATTLTLLISPALFSLHCSFSYFLPLNYTLQYLLITHLIMAISRKRKCAETAETTSKQTTCSSSLKATKSTANHNDLDGKKETPKRRKTASTRSSTPPPPVSGATAVSSQKRKRTLDAVTEQSDEDNERGIKIQKGFFKQFAKPKEAVTPQSLRFKNVIPVSPLQTPTKGAQRMFDRLNLHATSPAMQLLNKRTKALETPPTSPETDRLRPNAVLPTELRDLLSLHASFLTALSLNSAHSGGSTAAIAVKALLPLVTANWRKRSVTIPDIRKILALTQKAGPSFVLEDRARAGIYLVRAEQNGSGSERTNNYIDESELNAVFEDCLRKVWNDWSNVTPAEHLTGRAFIRQLPLVDMIQTETSKSTSVLFTRGQQRLADLKAGQAAAKAEAELPQTLVTSIAKDTSGIQNRNTSLLDRILAKQAVASNLPAGPTRTELERKSALHRVEDVTRVLGMLAAGHPRASFSMTTMVQHLQQSLRTPITREEVERCLGIMAAEIMPSFVKIISNGSMHGVVVTNGGKIGFADLKERLANAGA
jgi:hypothetical protein